MQAEEQAAAAANGTPPVGQMSKVTAVVHFTASHMLALDATPCLANRTVVVLGLNIDLL